MTEQDEAGTRTAAAAETEAAAEGEPAPDHAPDPELEDGPSIADADVDPEGPDGREVEVPLRLYKSVTVFSTTIAVLFIVIGFLF